MQCNTFVQPYEPVPAEFPTCVMCIVFTMQLAAMGEQARRAGYDATLNGRIK